jgi:F0F1-type ATP synthase membrane subunit b/b'
MKTYLSIIESVKEQNPALGMAAENAFRMIFENIDEDKSELSPDASVDELKKYKETVDKSIDTKIQASAIIDKANEDVQKITDEINKTKNDI